MVETDFVKSPQYVGDYCEFYPLLLHFAFLPPHFEKTEAGPADERSGSCGRAMRGLCLPLHDDSPLFPVVANLVRDHFPVRVCLSPSPF